jgi:2-hydroxy-6-oxonona-2,4-dienedioate hydrolase
MRALASSALMLHAAAHLVGFLTLWGLLTAGTGEKPADSPPTFLRDRMTLGRAMARAVGLLWLALSISFAVVAIGVWRSASWSSAALAMVALLSLGLSLVSWPRARVGVYVNLAILIAITGLTYRAYRRDLAAERARALAGSMMLATRCGTVEYAAEGTGTPVLVLHGTGGGWDQGLFAARGLVAHGFRIIAPSRFGYLRTPLPADPSPAAEADTWACFLDALGLDRVPVMSFSAGTAPALQLALRHPDRVSSLVLVVPAAGGILPPQAMAPPAFVMNVVLRYDLPMWAMLRYFPRTSYNLAAVPATYVAGAPADEVQRLSEGMRMILPVRQRSRGMMNDARSQSGSERRYAIETITAPTLLISAEDDLYRTLTVARHAVRVIPEARLISFSTGGHFLLGHEEEVWPAVASFMRRATPQPQKTSASTTSARNGTP